MADMFKPPLRRIALAFAVFAAATPLFASAFTGGTATGNPLVIRATPSASGAMEGSYSMGEDISLTGPCKRFSAGGALIKSFNVHTGTLPKATYQSWMGVTRTWCQVWHDKKTSGAFEDGWVRASFVTLQ